MLIPIIQKSCARQGASFNLYIRFRVTNQSLVRSVFGFIMIILFLFFCIYNQKCLQKFKQTQLTSICHLLLINSCVCYSNNPVLLCVRLLLFFFGALFYFGFDERNRKIWQFLTFILSMVF